MRLLTSSSGVRASPGAVFVSNVAMALRSLAALVRAATALGSRDSSAWRASDRRSESPQFDPGSRHCMIGAILLCIGWQASCLILVMLHMSAGTLRSMACAAIHRHMVEAHSAMRTLVVCRLKVANGRRHTTYSHRAPRSKVWRTMVGAKQAVNT